MMNLLKRLMIALLPGLLLPAPAALASEGVEVHHVGANNALVRVTGRGRYLPVQESSDDARINILVDGNLTETIYVRLAKSKTDYRVPYDLQPYEGHNVILDIVLLQDRSSIREAKEDVCWRDYRLSETFDSAFAASFRRSVEHRGIQCRRAFCHDQPRLPDLPLHDADDHLAGGEREARKSQHIFAQRSLILS